MRDIVLIAFVVLGCICVLVGAIIAVLAVIKGSTADSHFEVKDTVKFGGAGLGMAGVGGAFLVIVLYNAPEVPPSLPPPSQSGNSSPNTSSSTSPGLNRTQAAFRTPSGNVYCSSYLNKDKMGCVITKHNWGKVKRCKYLYALEADGEARVTICPDETDMADLLSDINPPTLTPEEYDVPFDLGVATCTVSQKMGTTCSNSDHFFRIAIEGRDSD